GAIFAEPLDLLVLGRGAAKGNVADVFESIERSLAHDWKAPHQHRIDPRLSCRIFIAPRDVILGARRKHGDIVMGSQPLGHLPAVRLGSAGDVGAVPMHHARNLHPPSLAPWSPSRLSSHSLSFAFSIASSSMHANRVVFSLC